MTLTVNQYIAITCIFIATILLFYTAHFVKKYLITKTDLLRYDVEMNLQLDHETVIKEIDSYILNTLNEYRIYNVDVHPDLIHINSEMEGKICEEVSKLIEKRMSGLLIRKLMLFYDEQSIPDIIGSHIFIAVTNFCIDFNNQSANGMTDIFSKM